MRPTEDYGSDHGGHGLRHHEPLYTDALHNEDVAHEHSDVNIRSLLMFALGLTAIVVFAFVAMKGMFIALENMAAKNDPVLSPYAIPSGQVPPEPRLLLNEPSNLAKQRSIETEALTTYGWENEAAGVARLPIEEAKKLLLHHGVPYRADGPTDPWLGSRAMGPNRGESSSGRAIPLAPATEAALAPEKPAAPPHKGH